MGGHYRPPERFWTKVRKTDSCWIWSGSKIAGGYGRYMLRGVRTTAHRVAWELTNGTISNGIVICHRCDNPPCVNPSHLFAAPQVVNVRDMISKGRVRYLRSEEVHTRKLTRAQVEDIRAMEIPHRCKAKVARSFGITHGNLNFILSGKSWK